MTRLFLIFGIVCTIFEGSEILLKGITIEKGRILFDFSRGNNYTLSFLICFFYLFGIFNVDDCTYNLFELKKFIVQIFNRPYNYYRLFQSLEDYFSIRILIMEKYRANY